MLNIKQQTEQSRVIEITRVTNQSCGSRGCTALAPLGAPPPLHPRSSGVVGRIDHPLAPAPSLPLATFNGLRVGQEAAVTAFVESSPTISRRVGVNVSRAGDVRAASRDAGFSRVGRNGRPRSVSPGYRRAGGEVLARRRRRVVCGGVSGAGHGFDGGGPGVRRRRP